MHIVKDSGEMDFVNVHMITKGDVSYYLIQKLTDTAYQNVKDGTPNGLKAQQSMLQLIIKKHSDSIPNIPKAHQTVWHHNKHTKQSDRTSNNPTAHLTTDNAPNGLTAHQTVRQHTKQSDSTPNSLTLHQTANINNTPNILTAHQTI